MRLIEKYSTKIINDACHPYEEEVVRLCGNYLETVHWPIERIGVKINFMVRAGVHSDNILELIKQGNMLTGIVTLYYNALYIQQHCKQYFIEVVPHEIAHILAEANAYKRNMKITKHGAEWMQWLKSLSHRATLSASGPGKIFDDRPIRLHSGGIPCLCECVGDNGFQVVSKRSQKKLTHGGVICLSCKNKLVPTTIESTPIHITNQIAFIREQLCRR